MATVGVKGLGRDRCIMQAANTASILDGRW